MSPGSRPLLTLPLPGQAGQASAGSLRHSVPGRCHPTWHTLLHVSSPFQSRPNTWAGQAVGRLEEEEGAASLGGLPWAGGQSYLLLTCCVSLEPRALRLHEGT